MDKPGGVVLAAQFVLQLARRTSLFPGRRQIEGNGPMGEPGMAARHDGLSPNRKIFPTLFPAAAINADALGLIVPTAATMWAYGTFAPARDLEPNPRSFLVVKVSLRKLALIHCEVRAGILPDQHLMS
jgi:hypothetical protein